MITILLGDALAPGHTNEDPQGFDYCIYVVRSEDDVLYVGESYSPRERIRQHVYTHTEIGMWIRGNRPESLEWMVDLYSLGDFRIPVKRFGDSPRAFKNHARAIERQLIEKYAPIFNAGLR